MADTSLSPQFFHLTRQSTNRKTGPIPVSTSSASTCPLSCPLRQVCYGKYGPLSLHWRQVSDGRRGLPFDSFLDQIRQLPAGQLWRHNEAGDLLGIGDRINTDQLSALVEANQGRSGFTYTHKPVLNHPDNRRVAHQANQQGFTVNLSADSVAEADQLVALDIGPVAVVVPEHQQTNFTTPAGHRVVICPNVKNKQLTCEKCRLCARANRKVIVGFPVHGTGKKHFEGRQA